MLLMCGAQMAIENFLPTYIFENLDVSLTVANLVSSGGAIAGVVFSIILGKLSDSDRQDEAHPHRHGGCSA